MAITLLSLGKELCTQLLCTLEDILHFFISSSSPSLHGYLGDDDSLPALLPICGVMFLLCVSLFQHFLQLVL